MRALISGAGIAGPALAYWLGRCGVRATVVERSPTLRVGGHAVDIRGVAVDVIERMGLIESVRAARTQLRMLSVVGRPGKPTLDIPVARAQPGHRDLEIVRDDLARILCEASRNDAEYLFGDAIAQIENGSDAAHVTFVSGRRQSFDLVVGADGQHSATRRIAFGPESAYARRFDVYVSIFGIPNLLGLQDRATVYNEPGRAIGTYSTVGNERAKALFLVRSTRPYDELREEPAQKQFLLEQFRGVGWETPRLLDALATCSDFYFDEVAQIHMPSWSNGRVVLLGDAAHGPSPLSGQGTTLALVGAYVLADALISARGAPHPSAAFAAYERRMRPYVLPNQDFASQGIRFLLPDSKLTIQLRNLLVRAMPLLARLGLRSDKQLQRISRAIELPELRAAA
jgi:2-polyprenyl-6-methoxyphenol hydroxylase-like FAD-dependent oxidoreductase